MPNLFQQVLLWFIVCFLLSQRAFAITYEYATVNAFPGLSLSSPLGIAHPPGETNRLFILEKGGNVVVVTNLTAPTRTVFMAVSNLAKSSELGLLGIAFHPGYETNGYLFLFYTPTNASGQVFNQLSRFETDPSDANKGLPESEVVLISQLDQAVNHNAGDVHFGDDGYLYVSLGDEGGANDQYHNSQTITKDFFSGILRIDVDKRPENLPPNSHPASSANYFVPADNPFVGATQFNGATISSNDVRAEFWAVGLRNPWRMSFDRSTSFLYCGDVGQNTREEIDIIVRGGNYGWKYREGTIERPGSGAPPAGFSSIDPIWDYARTGNATNIGVSVTGGVVYRGSLISQLVGAYIFADYASGNIWSLKYDGTTVSDYQRLAFSVGVAAFGFDPASGEVLLVNLKYDQIRRLVYRPVIDINLPVVTVTFPLKNSSVTSPNIVMQGTASDKQGVAQVLLQVNDSLFFQTASGTTNWTASVNVETGTNTVTVTAIDVNDNESAPVICPFFYSVTNELTVNINGLGTLTPDRSGEHLEITRNYSMLATPGAHHVFSNWTGTITSTNRSLTFTMESNMVLNANFIPNPFIPKAGIYYGLLSSTPAGHHNSGLFTLKIATNAGFSGKLFLDGNILGISGKFPIDGTVATTISRTKFAKSDLTVTLTVDTGNSDDQIAGTVECAEWSATLLGDRYVWSASNPATNLTNLYTLLLPNQIESPTPKGYGYGSVVVNYLGKIIFSGAVPDGPLAKQTVLIAKDGRWPLYVPLYRQTVVANNGLTLVTNKEDRGSISGWVTLTNSQMNGTLNWIKTGWTNAFYTNGFTNSFILIGSRYLRPAVGVRAFDFPQGTVAFEYGNLSPSFTNTAQLTTNNAFKAVGTNLNKMTLGLAKSTGIFKGGFVFPGTTNKPTPFAGAILQSDNTGGGFFLGTNETGAVLLERD